MTVISYTGNRTHPSARLRVRQYTPFLRNYGITLRDCSVPWDTTMPKQKWRRAAWALGTVAWRSAQIPASYTGAITLIQRQTLPGYYHLHRLMKGPCVLDVDDAIWLNRGGERVAGLARSCDAIICGNRYLMSYFEQWNRRVRLLPTPVDTELLKPGPVPLEERSQIIGWTGTSENYQFLYQIEKALARVLREHPQARLLTVSDKPPAFTELPPSQVEFVPWSVQAEADALQRMAVGLMPLDNTPWSEGKCSFKMLCYMAAAVPVVVSPVGMNREVLALGNIGYGPQTENEWVEALDAILRNRWKAATLGRNARQLAVSDFSLDVLSNRFSTHLYEIGASAAPQSVDSRG
jgi:glycosyltransferase involved in cell wall biosynthesis